MIRSVSASELPGIAQLLHAANDAPYDIGPVAEEKCFGAGIAGAPVVRAFEEDGAIRGVAVRCGKYLRLIAVDRAFRRRGIGTALLRDANAGVIAAEAGNYFTPGVVESDLGTIAFLRKSGYREKARTWNLIAECGGQTILSVPTFGQTGLSVLHKPPHSLLEFIEREFGKVWRFEVERGSAAFLDNIGFAAYEANNRGLGTFGPAGVAKAMRRRGYGRQLTVAALAGLRRLGYEQAIIPWTDALEYYRKTCGAVPAHRFVTFAVDSAA